MSIRDSTTLFSVSLACAGPCPDCRWRFVGDAAIPSSVESLVSLGGGGRFLGGRFDGSVDADPAEFSLDALSICIRSPLLDDTAAPSATSASSLDFWTTIFLGLKRSASSTFFSPSRIGLRQSNNSLTGSSLGPLEGFSLLLLLGGVAADLAALEETAVEASGTSSSKVLVRIDEVTSHHTVVKSSRIRHTLQVGANGFFRCPVKRNGTAILIRSN